MNLQDLRTLVGERIKTLRQEKGWSQKYLGELADSKESYICELEAGKRNFSIKKLCLIADALGAEVGVWIEVK